MRDVVWPALLEHSREFGDLGEADRRALEDTLTQTVARGLKEGICKKVAARLRAGDEWSDVKDSLVYSHALSCQFSVPGLRASTPASFRITAGEFEAVMAPFVAVPDDSGDGAPQSLLRPVIQTLARAHLTAEDLDVLILHGGSSLNPYVQRMLQDNVGRVGLLFSVLDVRSTPNPMTSVARGAALRSGCRSI